MSTTVYTDSDGDVAALGGRTVAVLGYGNQGAAQSQNIRDSGLPDVIIGNRDDDYRGTAAAAGFAVHPIAEAARRGDIVMLLLPDEIAAGVYDADVVAGLAPGDTLVVASGYNVAFGHLPVPEGVDLVMVAPRMIGAAVRSRYLDGVGFPCFVSVEQDATGRALRSALGIAKAIGGTRAGAIASSAREEAALDLFSEQALWPAILSILRSGYEVLHEAGFSDEAVLYEMYLSGEPAEIFQHVADVGLLGQMALHSPTSQFGQLRGLLGLDTGELRSRFSRVLHEDILSGRFAGEWSSASLDAESRLAELTEAAARHPLAKAERTILTDNQN